MSIELDLSVFQLPLDTDPRPYLAMLALQDLQSGPADRTHAMTTPEGQAALEAAARAAAEAYFEDRWDQTSEIDRALWHASTQAAIRARSTD